MTRRALLKRAGLLCIGLLAAMAIVYAWVNWQGERAWRAYLEERRSRGDAVRAEELIPPPVDAELDFLATPCVASSLASWRANEEDAATPIDRLRVDRLGRLQLPAPREQLSGWRVGESVRLADFVQGGENLSSLEAARVILQELQTVEATLNEISDAARARPYARLGFENALQPTQWLPERSQSYHRPYKLLFSLVAYSFEVRALARLETDDAAGGFQDILTCLDLTNLALDMPGIGHVFEAHFCATYVVQPIWQGLRDRMWTRRQLSELVTRLGELELGPALAETIRFELLADFNFAEQAIAAGNHGIFIERWTEMAASGMQSGFARVARLAPRGLYYYNLVEVGRIVDPLTLPGGIGIDGVKSFESALNRPISEVPFDFRTTAARTYSLVQVLYRLFPLALCIGHRQDLHLAAIAAALEAYRADRGAYPADLDALVPEVMDARPADLAGGVHALVYRLDSAGLPLVYSVGYNGIDEKGRRSKDNREGDWAWRYAPLEP